MSHKSLNSAKSKLGGFFGTTTTVEGFWRSHEKGTFGTVFEMLSPTGEVRRHESEDNYKESAINTYFELRKEFGSNGGHIRIIKFAGDILNNSKRLYWMCVNMGASLTHENGRASSGNTMYLVTESLGSAFFHWSTDPSEANTNDLVSTLEWTLKALEYMMTASADYWQDCRKTLEFLNSQGATQNALSVIATNVVLSFLGYDVDMNDLLSKVMLSVSRTYHDCKGDLPSEDAMTRLFVYFALLNIMNKMAIEDAVALSMEDFVENFQMHEDVDDDNLKIVIVMLRKFYPNTDKENLVKFGGIILEMISEEKLKSLIWNDILVNLREQVVLEGVAYHPKSLEGGSWEFDKETIPVDKTAERFSTRFKGPNWYTVGIIPSGDKGVMHISARHMEGTGGNPGVRIYCGNELTWRKKGRLGLTSNGGRGDGFGAPSALPGEPKSSAKVDLNKYTDEKKHLATTTWMKNASGGYDVSVQFATWNSSHEISYNEGDYILIAAKAMALDVTLDSAVPKDKVEEVVPQPEVQMGGTTVASIVNRTVASNTSGSTRQTTGRMLARSLKKL